MGDRLHGLNHFYRLIALLTLLSIGSAHAQSQTKSAPEDVQTPVIDLLSDTTNLPELIRRSLAEPSGVVWQRGSQTEQARLLAGLKAMGYLDARVELNAPDTLGGAEDGIEVRVEPGQQYSIGSVRIEGIKAPGLLDRLEDVAATAQGQWATAMTAEQLADRIVWRLGQTGYPFATVSTRLETLPDTTQAVLEVAIEPGAQAYYAGASYEKVDIGMLDWVQSKQPFLAGDVFSIDKLASFRAELLAGPEMKRARIDVQQAGPNAFALKVRYNRQYELPPNSVEMELGILALALSLLAIGWRQTVQAQNSQANLRQTDAFIGGLVLVSLALVGMRALSFLA